MEGSYYRRRRKRLALFKAACVLLIVCILLVCLDIQIRPTIKTMVAYEARNFAVRVIDQAVTEELSREDIRYDQLAKVNINAAGTVTSVETDAVGINRLKANITDQVTEAMQNLRDHDLQVPLGTLIGGQTFSGRGPAVEFRIIPIGYAESTIENEFLSAGINQTCHRIMMRVNISITAMIPGYSAATEISSEICLAETVIVGVVPEAFTKVTGDDRDPLSQLHDYEAYGAG